MKPDPETHTMPSGTVLTQHPEGFARSWRRITVEHLHAGQSAAYKDSVYESLITFEGGSASTVPGFDTGFGTRPDERRVKEVVKILVHIFIEGAARNWSDPYLKSLTKEAEGEGWTQWRVVIVQPYLD